MAYGGGDEGAPAPSAADQRAARKETQRIERRLAKITELEDSLKWLIEGSGDDWSDK